MLFVTVKGNLVVCPVDFPIYPDPREAFAVQVLEKLLVSPFFLADYGCEDCNHSLAFSAEAVRDPFRRLGLYFYVVDRTVRGPYPCKKQPEVIIDFSDSSHRTSGVFRSCFLLY